MVKVEQSRRESKNSWEDEAVWNERLVRRISKPERQGRWKGQGLYGKVERFGADGKCRADGRSGLTWSQSKTFVGPLRFQICWLKRDYEVRRNVF